MTLSSRRVLALTIVAALATEAKPIEAQACHGTPGGASVGYEYGKMSVGRSQGLSGALAGNRVALGAGAAVRDLGDFTGQQASLRFSFILPVPGIRICPGLGLLYQHDTWDRTDATLTAHNLSLRAGAGLGFEQHVAAGFSVNPFVVAQYDFTITALDFTPSGADSANVELTPDTLSRVQIEYGLIGRYGFLYGGIAAHRTGDQKGIRPYMARYIIGVSFSGIGGVKREEAAALPAHRSTRR
jgi:hypothetical protein